MLTDSMAQSILRKLHRIGIGERLTVSSAQIFVAQSFYLREITDHLPEADYVPFLGGELGETPHFNNLTMAQLRTYLSWRTTLKAGETISERITYDKLRAVSKPYVCLYLCELINDIVYDSPEETMNVLVAIERHGHWNYHWKDEFGWRRALVSDWWEIRVSNVTKSYYLVNHESLDQHYATYVQEKKQDDLEQGVLNYEWGYLPVVEYSSSHKISELGMYQNSEEKEKKEIEACVHYVLRRLERLFLKHETSLKKLFYSKKTVPYSLFHALTFDRTLDMVELDTNVALDKYFQGVKTAEGWQTLTLEIDEKRYAVGYILKYIEYHLRHALEYKSKVQPPKIDMLKVSFLKTGTIHDPTRAPKWKRNTINLLTAKNFGDVIERYVMGYFRHEVIPTGENGEAVEVNIDATRLEDIRAAHEVVAEKLKTQEEREAEEAQVLKEAKPVAPVSMSEVPQAMGFEGLKAMLTPEEIALLQQLKNGQTPPVDLITLETINEKALATISDNLLEVEGASALIYEEYVEELSLL